LRPRLTTGLPLSLAHTRMRLLATQPTIGGWVANPSLEGGQVAVLILHMRLGSHVTSAAYSCERGERITQLQYSLQLSLRTSENSVKAKFGCAPARSAYLPQKGP